ncbi:AraC family transcriptional regulator [Cohnella fermenti]|uniref:AraC family transcriptional regulator n=1 Tax=Cohnella fermenti TaxID=2565925 RepID=A0A4S4BIJ1_9BACL|nr:AraC family transcriptional regulator [Cohnella fermenti]THF74310.1 AraC family transcriptional regulator [Cohnella fermenti]
MRGYQEKAAHAWTNDSVRIIATPSTFAKQHLYYVQEAGIFQTEPGYFTERENLDSYLIVYTAAGRGKLKYGGKAYDAAPGQLFFIDCRRHQYYAPDSNDSWHLVWIHFHGSSSPAYYERYAAAGTPLATLPEDSRIPALLLDIVELHQQKTVQTELSVSRAIVDVLTELLQLASDRESTEIGLPSTVAAVMNYYDRHYAERLTLDGVAARFAIDKYHLAKSFKRHTGFSPNDYLINIRITRAKELLRFTDRTVAEIAVSVGIDNVSHFINLFRQRQTSTPLAYRKLWRS